MKILFLIFIICFGLFISINSSKNYEISESEKNKQYKIIDNWKIYK